MIHPVFLELQWDRYKLCDPGFEAIIRSLGCLDLTLYIVLSLRLLSLPRCRHNMSELGHSALVWGKVTSDI